MQFGPKWQRQQDSILFLPFNGQGELGGRQYGRADDPRGRKADNSSGWELEDLLPSRRLVGWADRGPGEPGNRQTR